MEYYSYIYLALNVSIQKTRAAPKNIPDIHMIIILYLKSKRAILDSNTDMASNKIIILFLQLFVGLQNLKNARADIFA